MLSGEVGLVKPDPKIYDLFLKTFAINPASAVYIDDLEPNVESAATFGMHAILFTDPAALRADLSELHFSHDLTRALQTRVSQFRIGIVDQAFGVPAHELRGSDRFLDQVPEKRRSSVEVLRVAGVKDFDVIVLGGGAAGLMCAIEAGKRGRRVAVLERADRVGKKILISGGGRCNFTNLYCKPENFLSANPHFCKSALARYTPTDFIALVARHGIAYHEKAKGQLFCDGSAREIVGMLEEECRRVHVQICVGVPVDQVGRGERFELRAGDQQFASDSVVVATGGLSIPKIGATSFGYDVARKFNLKMRSCYPGLVPLTFEAAERRRLVELAGVACEARVACDSQVFQDKMLFTHRGLSGPAILQISSYWNQTSPLTIDLAPNRRVTESVRESAGRRDLAAMKAALRTVLPQRLSDRWLSMHPITEWTNVALDRWETELHRWEIRPAGTEGFEKAEVTVGGVDTDELSSKTMECKRVPGLYFIGEVVDVTGQLGGFNFQWAWASGYAAGQVV